MRNKFLHIFLGVFACQNICAQGIWTQKANFTGSPRYMAVSFSISTKGYIGGGYNVIPDLWEWDQGLNTWSQKATCPVSQSLSFAFAIGSKGYYGIWNYNLPSGIYFYQISTEEKTIAIGKMVIQ
jgi:hypothetical protein